MFFPPKLPVQSEPVLKVSGVESKMYSFKDIDFCVHAGECLGMAGIIGAGRTELIRCIVGADPVEKIRLHLDGENLWIGSPKDAISKGIVYIPEDRRYAGLIIDQSINDNILLGNYDKISSNGWLRPKAITKYAENIIARFLIKGTPSQKIRQLSGGNQQKVLIGKWISRGPRVVVLDEPTRGIDIASRQEIYGIVQELTRKGTAVILVSSDLEEIMGTCHRCLVLCQGIQKGILSGKEMQREKIMQLATSGEQEVV